jgi:putative redox protein
MIKVNTKWNQNMSFISDDGKYSVNMDAKAPIGKGEGLTPKELVAVGLAGCTAMDVIAWMKKHKQDVTSFDINTEVDTTTDGHPMVFSKARLTFTMTGTVEREKLIEAVTLSQTKYCGVSAMLSKAFPIEYQVILNGETIHEGHASF